MRQLQVKKKSYLLVPDMFHKQFEETVYQAYKWFNPHNFYRPVYIPLGEVLVDSVWHDSFELFSLLEFSDPNAYEELLGENEWYIWLSHVSEPKIEELVEDVYRALNYNNYCYADEERLIHNVPFVRVW